MGELSISALETTFLIPGGTPPIYEGETDISFLICGTPYLSDLQKELTNLGSGDIVYISGWALDPNFPLSSPTFFQQLATLVQDQQVDVRVILWNPYTANFAKNVGVCPILGGAIAQATRGFPTGGTFPAFNWIAGITLRNQTVPPLSSLPLQQRVLLDWSGVARLGIAAQHQKAVVIYSSNSTTNANNPRLIAYVGGIDAVSNRLSDPALPAWHDVMVKLTGGAAADVLANFTQRWQEANTLPDLPGSVYDIATQALQKLLVANDPTQTLPLQPPPTPSSGAATNTSKAASVQIVRSFPLFKATAGLPPTVLGWNDPALAKGLRQISQCLVNAINQANSYIYVEDQVFFFPHAWMAQNSSVWGTSVLIPPLAAAASRGVKIILLGPGQKEGSNTPTQWGGADAWLSTQLVAKSGTNPPISINALSGAFVHAKVVIIDDLFAIVGSANFADRSMINEDIEMSAAMVSVPGFVPGTSNVSEIQTNPDSKLTTGSIVQDLRVQLWAYHFGYGSQLSQADVWAQLADTTQSLGLWDPNWGTGSLAIGSASPSLVINFLNTSASSGG